MNNAFGFKTLAEFLEYFQDEEICRQHFTAIRFRNGEHCPHCGHNGINHFAGGKRFRCKSCKQDFTIKTGTVFGESKLPIRKWFIAIYLLSTCNKGISSVQLAKQVGVTQKTAWFMDHRIRSAMKQNKGQLFGTVEVDETYIGGKAKNMHAKAKAKTDIGTGGKGKAIVMGIKSRAGEVRATVIESTDASQLHPFIKENVTPGSDVCTDEHRGYAGLAEYDFVRHVIKHGCKEYVRGDVHTNGIESFWALFKRGYYGIYHQMSKKHLQRYIDESAFRVNRRLQEMKQIFTDVVHNIADNQPLPYKELIA